MSLSQGLGFPVKMSLALVDSYKGIHSNLSHLLEGGPGCVGCEFQELLKLLFCGLKEAATDP